ncbi:HdeD family acid-resistance protein [Eudoraea chungangensis]|uniref:HdeD family acid-resistance protein n=1 Tax=Eudoraea chungangensis TaxID=1481905 RepID=UPI0023EC6D23|nr:HdeD family acid-resistance protein [Eudoraea chungangensis]
MSNVLIKNWYLLTIKGVLLIIFALMAFFNPLWSASALTMWFALLIAIFGIFTMVSAISSWKEREDKWMFLLEGVVSLVFGLILFSTPGITLLLVSFAIGFWFVFIGVSRISMAIQLRKEIEGEGWLIAGGILSVIFGLIIFARPALGVGSLMYLIAFFAFAIGVLFIAVSLKLRKGGKWVKAKMEDLKDEIDLAE